MLYLVRHAIAHDPRIGQSDADRALTPEGAAKFRKAAAGIARLLRKAPPRVLLTSPLRRARQTADLLMDAFDDLKLKLDLKETAALAPPGNLPALLKQAEKQDALAVGHEPFLSDAIAQLCFRSAGNMEFKKGALAALEFEHARSAKLLFLLQPSQLRRLA